MKLNTARIFVRDLEAAQSFYRDALGLALRGGGAGSGYCVFDAGAARLIVESVEESAPAEDQALVGRFTGLSFTVQDIAAKYEQLLSRRVQFTGAPEPQSWGGTLATFMDPAGNELQLVQGPNAG